MVRLVPAVCCLLLVPFALAAGAPYIKVEGATTAAHTGLHVGGNQLIDGAGKPSSGGAVLDNDYATAVAQAKARGVPVFVDVWAPW